MEITLDHVTVAGRSLDALTAAVEGIGLEPTYGGTHSNGVTHMSTVALPDGTYLELISTCEPGARSPWWDTHIQADAGPCAWAVRVDDAAATATALVERGIAVEGPVEYARERPDGVSVEWELVFLGDGEPGSVLPFCIADRTPRECRVGEPLTDTGLNGISTVVVSVSDRAAAVERFRAVFDLAKPAQFNSDQLGAAVASFPDAPVALAEPQGPGWLHERLDAVGQSPCAYLLATGTDVQERYPTTADEAWDGGSIAWIDPEAIGGIRYLGLLDAS